MCTKPFLDLGLSTVVRIDANGRSGNRIRSRFGCQEREPNCADQRNLDCDSPVQSVSIRLIHQVFVAMAQESTTSFHPLTLNTDLILRLTRFLIPSSIGAIFRSSCITVATESMKTCFGVPTSVVALSCCRRMGSKMMTLFQLVSAFDPPSKAVYAKDPTYGSQLTSRRSASCMIWAVGTACLRR